MANPWEEPPKPVPAAPCASCAPKEEDEEEEEKEDEGDGENSDSASDSDGDGDGDGDGDKGDEGDASGERDGDTREPANDTKPGEEPMAARSDQALAEERTQRFDDGSTLTTRPDGSTSATPRPAEVVGRDVQRFDDGTSLTTTRFDDGTSISYAREQNVQVFDDGSKLVTDTSTYPSGRTYTDISSVDSLEARLADEPFLNDPRTATPADVELARDILDNMGPDLMPHHREALEGFINDYYLGKSEIFGNEPPTPTNYPDSGRRVL